MAIAINPSKSPTADSGRACSSEDKEEASAKKVARCALQARRDAVRTASAHMGAAAAASQAAHSFAAAELKRFEAKPLSFTPTVIGGKTLLITKEMALDGMEDAAILAAIPKAAGYVVEGVVHMLCNPGPLEHAVCDGIKSAAVGTGRLVKAHLPAVIKDPLKKAAAHIASRPTELERDYGIPAERTADFFGDVAAISGVALGGAAFSGAAAVKTVARGGAGVAIVEETSLAEAVHDVVFNPFSSLFPKPAFAPVGFTRGGSVADLSSTRPSMMFFAKEVGKVEGKLSPITSYDKIMKNPKQFPDWDGIAKSEIGYLDELSIPHNDALVKDFAPNLTEFYKTCDVHFLKLRNVGEGGQGFLRANIPYKIEGDSILAVVNRGRIPPALSRDKLTSLGGHSSYKNSLAKMGYLSGDYADFYIVREIMTLAKGRRTLIAYSPEKNPISRDVMRMGMIDSSGIISNEFKNRNMLVIEVDVKK